MCNLKVNCCYCRFGRIGQKVASLLELFMSDSLLLTHMSKKKLTELNFSFWIGHFLESTSNSLQWIRSALGRK